MGLGYLKSARCSLSKEVESERNTKKRKKRKRNKEKQGLVPQCLILGGHVLPQRTVAQRNPVESAMCPELEEGRSACEERRHSSFFFFFFFFFLHIASSVLRLILSLFSNNQESEMT